MLPELAIGHRCGIGIADRGLTLGQEASHAQGHSQAVVPGALAILCSTGVAAAQSDVAFVNICRDGSLGSAAIDRIRTPVLDDTRLNGLGAGPLRAALEQPLARAPDPDLAETEKLRAQAWDAYSAFSRDRALQLVDSARDTNSVSDCAAMTVL